MRSIVAAIAIPLLLFAAPAPAEEPAPLVHTGTRVLEAGEVERYIGALRELTRLGLDASAELPPDASQARQGAAAIEYSGEMQKALARHDFDAASFTEVHWNVVMAYLADALSAQNEELERAQAQQQLLLEEMKEQMPPEQYQAAAAAMQSLLPTLSAATAAPEANRKLVAAHRAELDALFEAEESASE